MKYLRIVANRKLRNLSWKIRPAFLAIDEEAVLFIVCFGCFAGFLGVIA